MQPAVLKYWWLQWWLWGSATLGLICMIVACCAVHRILLSRKEEKKARPTAIAVDTALPTSHQTNASGHSTSSSQRPMREEERLAIVTLAEQYIVTRERARAATLARADLAAETEKHPPVEEPKRVAAATKATAEQNDSIEQTVPQKSRPREKTKERASPKVQAVAESNEGSARVPRAHEEPQQPERTATRAHIQSSEPESSEPESSGSTAAPHVSTARDEPKQPPGVGSLRPQRQSQEGTALESPTMHQSAVEVVVMPPDFVPASISPAARQRKVTTTTGGGCPSEDRIGSSSRSHVKACSLSEDALAGRAERARRRLVDGDQQSQPSLPIERPAAPPPSALPAPPQWAQRSFDEVDVDGDGFTSRAEFEAFIRSPRTPQYKANNFTPAAGYDARELQNSSPSMPASALPPVPWGDRPSLSDRSPAGALARARAYRQATLLSPRSRASPHAPLYARSPPRSPRTRSPPRASPTRSSPRHTRGAREGGAPQYDVVTEAPVPASSSERGVQSGDARSFYV